MLKAKFSLISKKNGRLFRNKIVQRKSGLKYESKMWYVLRN